MDHYKGLLELQELGMVRQLITSDHGFQKGDVIVRASNEARGCDDQGTHGIFAHEQYVKP